MHILRNIPFMIWFYGFLIKIQPIKQRIKKYRSEGNDEMERTEILKAENAWGEALIDRAKITLKIQRNGELPDGPVVFVANHQSYWDIPVFFSSIREKPFGFVAKESLRKVPAFGSWIADIRSVFIKREDARASLRAIEEGVRLLKRGYSLVIFPEGTRARGSGMKQFKKGSLRLAVKAGVPIVPVSLNGTYHAFEEKGYVRPARVDFIVHPAIETKDMTKQEAAELTDQIEAIIREGLK